MSKKEQANIILKELDSVLCVNWNMKDVYLNQIIKALNTIEKGESYE